MGQIDAHTDVVSLLSPYSAKHWSPERGYDKLVVDSPSDGADTAADCAEPLRTGSVHQQKMATAAISLWNDDLPTAHAVFQADDSADASLWHAILHRREGDFSNSKYWLARAGAHPVYPVLTRLAAPLLTSPDVASVFLPLKRAGWSAPGFADAVRQLVETDDPAGRSLAVHLQRLEWQALFYHCARQNH